MSQPTLEIERVEGAEVETYRVEVAIGDRRVHIGDAVRMNPQAFRMHPRKDLPFLTAKNGEEVPAPIDIEARNADELRAAVRVRFGTVEIGGGPDHLSNRTATALNEAFLEILNTLASRTNSVAGHVTALVSAVARCAVEDSKGKHKEFRDLFVSQLDKEIESQITRAAVEETMRGALGELFSSLKAARSADEPTKH